MKKHIPNTITCLNLFSGCIGVLMALKGDYMTTAYCVLASGIFDFFDGMVARLLHVKSNIGKELDSLADMVSFGFLPGAILYMLLSEVFIEQPLFAYLGFVVTVFSALRLAKFNLDERQTTDFIGLNTPMNTFYVLSLPFIAEKYPDIILNPFFLLISTALTSFLLVSEIRLFSMKLSSLAWSENKYKFIFVILAVVLFAVFQFVALPIILLSYILLSLLHFQRLK
ncbi:MULTISPECIES: CDP-alcohol phosphatidyltransferase family protein [Sphingobacterium]|uniref:CDP-alcohol phosphatidyltransferase family protein n=1 Tax=Sphingobacterium kitahiroshimense TaxID=470446 RepID=A0ABV0C084_9SPHI|nr:MULTISPECIES: CDP-alcohol phosphatidyltransferase family protein [Sphingobacterium]MCS3557337.1 CDP-diacylglycerol--serine O-phosphatidyltransferase [Sphingobacterium sp. JUb21]MCW2260882.1 CDP-diacylglycerol--serine O-phosphatidyltransferase [Sphingobacterium kitahiroshimense]TCR01596.1 CDP-diacylglycerol--serine O-phosphatidyltransferase [Sphingobacterium sp. JUb20]TCR09180.1 CDP-diacylglycerol--serine O-phosphatidyltransferase [Sphingobacterium sp. JUb78]